ncbi:hypothetical protein F5148DRAFT_1247353 [Russula earlei]|uniref:Uncharacterized protein n=1 Tax=Russula earlei TaxID=71964 RepID=A0ACC0TV82_9AGAM|nr:hypothetical protein F5148DRAFT_1247353 [Russula earlei]
MSFRLRLWACCYHALSLFTGFVHWQPLLLYAPRFSTTISGPSKASSLEPVQHATRRCPRRNIRYICHGLLEG